MDRIEELMRAASAGGGGCSPLPPQVFDAEAHHDGDGEEWIEFAIFLLVEEKPGEEALRAAAAEVLAVTAPHREAYLWHHEAFALTVVAAGAKGQGEVEPPHLRGLVRVGEAVEDEWFVAWLLRLATAHPPLARRGAVARVADRDGDFLQIEAAMQCPHDWLAPETAANRTWLRAGAAHFVAEDLWPPGRPLPTAAALQLMRSRPLGATAAPWLEEALAPRFEGYPAHIAEEQHGAACYLPASVAAVLARRPALATAAVRALRDRDPGELASVGAGQAGGGGGRGGGGRRFAPAPLVPVRLAFPRRVFGMLARDEVQPPKAFIGAMAEVLARECGGSGSSRKDEDGAAARVQAAVERGVRLACGLEMLYWRSKRRAQEPDQQERSAGAAAKPSWEEYLGRLGKRGFFDGVIEGSADHRQRVAHAREAFARLERHGALRSQLRKEKEEEVQVTGGEPSTEPLHAFVDGVLAGGVPPRASWPPSLAALAPDDEEGWMDVDAGTLEGLLERYGQSVGDAVGGGMFGDDGEDDEEEASDEDDEEEGARVGKDGEEEDEDLERLLAGMKGFIGAMAGLEGAEVSSASAAARAAMLDDEGEAAEAAEGISFDVGRLLKILRGDDVREALGRAGLGNEEEDSDDSEEEMEAGDYFQDEIPAAKAKPSSPPAAVGSPVLPTAPPPSRVPTMELPLNALAPPSALSSSPPAAAAVSRGLLARGVYMREVERDDTDDEEEEEGEQQEQGASAAAAAAAAMEQAEKEEEEGEADMEAYMAQLDRELRGTTLDASFQRRPPPQEEEQGQEGEEGGEGEELPPVDLDLNLVRHLLESYASQGAAPGPASNILGEIFAMQEQQQGKKGEGKGKGK